MTDRELMQQALEDICGARLCEVNSMSSRREALRLLGKAADALRERLAQPVQEPVAWRVRRSDGEYELYFVKTSAERAAECYIKQPLVEPLYTTPPRREWQGLTMDDMADLAVSKEWLAGARWAEAKLREKNT